MSEEKTLRDTFAAAALTGLIERRPWPVDKNESATICYQFADAMLRERARNGASDARETVTLTLTDAERAFLRRLQPSECPFASYSTVISPEDRKTVFGLLKRLGGET